MTKPINNHHQQSTVAQPYLDIANCGLRYPNEFLLSQDTEIQTITRQNLGIRSLKGIYLKF